MFSKFGQRHEEIAFLVKQKYAKEIYWESFLAKGLVFLV